MNTVLMFALLAATVLATVYAMPVGDELIGGKVPHPNSAAGQALSGNTEQPVIGKVPHPNSAKGKELSGQQTVGGGVPHPNSAAGQELTNKAEEKHVLEGGTQVKPWLTNQPDIATIRKQNPQ